MRQLFEYDPDIGYRFIPGLRARVPREGGGGYLVAANAQGFRCAHDFRQEATPGKRRILLFGDSFTAGEAVSNPARYGDRLEQRIADLEVYNFGIPGTGPDQHWLAYRKFAAHVHADLLVLAPLVENIRRVAARYRYYRDEHGGMTCWAKPYFRIEGDRLALHNVPAPREPVAEESLPAEEREAIDRVGRFPRLNQLLMRTGTVGLAHRVLGHSSYPQYERPDDPDWTLLRRILSEWIRGHAGPVLLVPLPVYYHIEEIQDPSAYQARFREVAEEVGCHYHDPLPDLLAHPMSARKTFRFDTDAHYSEAGHEALADSLAPVLERILPVRP